MPEVILTDEQAQVLSTATGEVLVRDRHGRVLGRVKPSDDEQFVFEEEASATTVEPMTGDTDDIFAEMQPYIATGHADVDDSREAIYSRLEGE